MGRLDQAFEIRKKTIFINVRGFVMLASKSIAFYSKEF